MTLAFAVPRAQGARNRETCGRWLAAQGRLALLHRQKPSAAVFLHLRVCSGTWPSPGAFDIRVSLWVDGFPAGDTPAVP